MLIYYIQTKVLFKCYLKLYTFPQCFPNRMKIINALLLINYFSYINTLILNVTSQVKYASHYFYYQKCMMACDYDVNWSFITYGATNFYQITYYGQRTNGITNYTQKQLNLKFLIKVRGHKTNNITNQRYFTIDQTNILQIYNGNITQLRMLNNVTDAVFGFTNSQIFYINTTTNNISKFNISNPSIIKSININNRTALQIFYQDPWLVVYFQDKNNISKAYISIFDQNLTLTKQFTVTFAKIIAYIGQLPYKYNHTVDLQPNLNLIIRSYQRKVQIWNITGSPSLFNTITVRAQVFSAVYCVGYIVVYVNGTLNFYKYPSLNFILSKIVTGNNNAIGQLKCLQSIDAVGLYFPLSANLRVTFYYINDTSNSTFGNNTNNNTNNSYINSTANDTINDTSYSMNLSIFIHKNIPTINQVNQTITNSVAKVNNFFSNMIQSPQFNKSTQAISKTAGIVASSSIGSSLFRPLAFFFQQLMLYSYHYKVYPDIVELVITNFDAFAYLRIKPNFFNYQLSISYIDQINAQMLNISDFMAQRKPSTLFFIDTIISVYLDNIVMVLCSYVLIYLLYKITSKIYKKCKKLQLAHQYFYSKSLWWNIPIMFLSFNNRGLAFYSFAQLQLASSSDYIQKLNIILTIFVLSVLLCYTFCFYFLIFRYENPTQSRQILQMGRFSMQSYGMQMGIQCIRGFTQGLIHGCFIRNQQFQVASLIIVDIITLVFVLMYYRYFKHKLTFAFTLIYSLFFLLFNVFLTLYSFSLQMPLNFDYNLIFTIIICVLSATTLLRTIHVCIMQIWQIIKSIRNNNRIQNSDVGCVNKVDSSVNKVSNCTNIQSNSQKRSKVIYKNKWSGYNIKSQYKLKNTLDKQYTQNDKPDNKYSISTKNTSNAQITTSKKSTFYNTKKPVTNINHHGTLINHRKKDKQVKVKSQKFLPSSLNCKNKGEQLQIQTFRVADLGNDNKLNNKMSLPKKLTYNNGYNSHIKDSQSKMQLCGSNQQQNKQEKNPMVDSTHIYSEKHDKSQNKSNKNIIEHEKRSTGNQKGREKERRNGQSLSKSRKQLNTY